jgi:hypothetical protein
MYNQQKVNNFKTLLRIKYPTPLADGNEAQKLAWRIFNHLTTTYNPKIEALDTYDSPKTHYILFIGNKRIDVELSSSAFYVKDVPLWTVDEKETYLNSTFINYLLNENLI